MLWVVLAILATAALAPAVVAVARRASGWLLALVPLGAFAYFVILATRVGEGETIRQVHGWVPGLDASLAFYLDGLSLLFALLVSGIGVLIVVYSNGYMAHHPMKGRFFAFLLAFMASMLGLVLADNVWAFFVFFELTSLTSYLLIGFDHEKESARRAARQALVVTGAGGLALMAGLILLSMVGGASSFSELIVQGDAIRGSGFYTAILVLVCAAAFTKSAQFPFQFWLPAAMAGPTPVSAYLHSATMVKAGVYLLARLSPALSGTTTWTVLLTSVGAFTMLLTAWLAVRHTDFKLVLAYTTVMVLGLLVMLLGLGGEEAILAAMVFILAHAFYKGALFMVAGNVDHATGTRDITRLGGLRGAMPITAAAGVATALSMGGIPPLFGYVGKELVYEAILHEAGAVGAVLMVTAVAANAALIAVSLALAVKPFLGREYDAADAPHLPHEAMTSMWLGPVVLGVIGIIYGVRPMLLDDVLAGPAASAVMGAPADPHLALWHGLTPTLAWSLVTIALGVSLYLVWERLHRSWPIIGVDRALGDGPSRAFERGLFALARGAERTTNVLQNGALRYYLLTIFCALCGLVIAAMAVERGLTWPSELGTIRFYEMVLALLVATAAAVAAWAPSRFVAVLALGSSGYAIALLYLLFGAPDLAMTQFAIETLTVILLVLVLINVPRWSVGTASTGSRLRDVVVALGVGGILTVTMLAVLSHPLDRYVSDYLTEQSVPAAKGHNVVNVILVDFRAFDTLGEITVLALAGLGVYALMSLTRREADE